MRNESGREKESSSESLWLIIKQAPRPKAVEPGPDYLRIYLKVVREKQAKEREGKRREGGKVATLNRTFSVFLFVLFSGCCFCF